MIGDKAATEFLEAIVDRVAEKLLPTIIEQLKTESIGKPDITMEVHEAAPYIGISPEMLYKLCANKRIPHIPLSSTGRGRPKLLFSSASIDTWKKEQEKMHYKKEDQNE
ncbi:helix-turn-helix domain-containing protein [Paenibacillus sp. Cedars]|uniref:helix-turn-helix domain-containing protein n=1 Tax=Paenibacillus sp. Cedars TaxID=1980674 RepID=UPI0011659891|nr:helix-turn-helix domain-containing protein [Paenibacillus sp. Cedars]AWP28754.1 hypothetical protein B9D94_19920 [Paenibacillus sp. Cedars]